MGRQLLGRRCWLIGSAALLKFRRVAALLSGRRGQMQLLEAVVFHQILGHGGLAGTFCCVIVLVTLVSSIRDREYLPPTIPINILTNDNYQAEMNGKMGTGLWMLVFS